VILSNLIGIDLDNGNSRSQLSSLFRVPLNVFVVVSLLTGASSARYAVLTACAIMLCFSSIMTGVFIVGRACDDGTETLSGRLE
jgi:hypothetical protein